MSDAPHRDAGPAIGKIEPIVQAVLDAPPRQREQVLQQKCGSDAALRAAVQRLLAIPESALDQFFDRTAEEALLTGASDGLALPGRIGNYEILRKIGEGGMGVVYEARQENPRRIVALKVIRPPLGAESMQKRFWTETHALGQLQHPGIARIYEAGTHRSNDGQSVPYFAMELVGGPSLDVYVRERKLSIRDMLALFVRICDAVAYAHARGVIHRDLKPGNILVQEEARPREGGEPELRVGSLGAAPSPDAVSAPVVAQPKIIDFGVARLIESDLAVTRQTDAGQVIGTLAYMSPEQLGGPALEVGGESDVYSLGIILYELVAGRAPFDLRNRTLPDAIRVIREAEATRLSLIDARLSGDIETIVAKAIEKPRARRYASAAELAADIRRYLRDEPILARPVSTYYQLRKFARRHRGLVAGLIIAGVALIAGVIVSLTFAFSESRLRQLADDRAQEASRQAKIAAARESQARHLAYRAGLAAASGALQTGNVSLARESVAAAPSELRGWEWQYLNYLADRSERVLSGHSGAVLFSADGRGTRLATADSAGKVRLWDTGIGKLLRIWPDADVKNGLAMDSGGRYVLWSSTTSTVMVSTETGEMIWQKAGALQVSPRAFHPRENAVVVCGKFARQVEILDARSGAATSTIDTGQELYQVQFSPDGRWISARSNHGHLALIDPASGHVRWCAVGWSSAFFSHRSQLACWTARNSRDFELEFVSTEACQALGTRTFPGGHPQGLWDIDAISGRVALCDPNGRLRLFDGLQGAPLLTTPAHAGGVDVRFSGDGRRLFTSGSDGEVRVWSADMSPSPLSIPAAERDWAYGGAVAPNGRLLCRVGWGCVTVIDTQTTATLWRRYCSGVFHCAAAFNPDTSLVAVGGQEGEIHVLDAQTGELLGSTIVPEARLVFSLAWLPGNLLLAALDTGQLRIIDPFTANANESILGAHGSPATCVAITGNGRMAASGSGNGLPGRDFGEFAAGDDNAVCLWDVASRQRIHRLCGHAAAITALAFTPDGERVASGSRDRTVILWDTATGEAAAPSIDCGGAVDSLAFSRDAQRLAIAAGGSVRIHDARTGELLLSQETHDTGSVHTLGFLPVSQALVSSGFDTAIMLHEISPLSDFDAARGTAIRARAYVESNRPTHELAADLFSALEHDDALDKSIREEALRYCRAFGDPLTRFFSDAIVAAGRRDLTLSEYLVALRKFEDARSILRERWRALPIMGLLQYRLGRLDDAFQSLTLARDDCRRAAVAPSVTLLAGLSLTSLARGDRQTAEASANELRMLIAPADVSALEERAMTLLREVETELRASHR